MTSRNLIRGSDAWSPVFDGTDAEQAWDAISAVAASLADIEDETIRANPGLAGGTTGLGLFYSVLASATGDAGYAATAERWLDRSADEFATRRQWAADLYVGPVGYAWLEALLQPGGGAVDVGDDVLQLVDADAARGRGPRQFDLITGLVGTGVYALERADPAGLDRVRVIVDALATQAVEDPDGITWWTDPAWLPPERAKALSGGYVDLGLAHGVSGVVAFLAGAVAAGAENAQEPLLAATSWLCAQQGRVRDDDDPAAFPALVRSGSKTGAGGRLAWCYGDLGVAAALSAAGAVLQDDAVLQRAEHLALRSARRTPVTAGIVDAGLCHGSAGLGHLFNRLAHEMDNSELGDASRLCLADAIDRRIPEGPYGGYTAMLARGPEGLSSLPCASLLEGAAGVGLALLAAVTTAPPDWDSFMLMRPPLRQQAVAYGLV